MDREAKVPAAETTPESRPRVFSLRQANRALVLIRKIVADMVTEYARVLEFQEVLELEQHYGSGEGLGGLREDVSAAVGRIRGYVEELEAVGVELQDFATGTVDFPARAGGREVRFCWRLGEERILYFHGAGEGLTDRRPVAELTGPAGRAGRVPHDRAGGL